MVHRPEGRCSHQTAPLPCNQWMWNTTPICYASSFCPNNPMLIGVPKEVKDHESRVGIVPAGVKALVEAGHKVLVETKAGELSSMSDEDYKQAGAEIASSAADVWRRGEMIVKVK